MSTSSEGGDVESELRALRDELRGLRQEQREMARAIDQMLQTFRSLALQLGIASEPYARDSKNTSNRDLPGFA